MHQGNWSCSKCKTAINELPFQPDESRTNSLVCVDCYKKRANGDGSTPRPPKTMYEGMWTCSGCGGAITQLPFEPDESRLGSLTCLDCHRASRGGGERKMFEGNWKCSGCNSDIKSLPFEPREGGENKLKCLDCYRNNK